ncbi:hypothetical protein GWC95_09045 [Sediminibacterium roseum]|uniref:Uncharacterized protein n=1 Tax=Sediminibacterium roseum TaxID=1978412 RepID=A0ABW9ZWH9_9BACT|nr:hypothetical protein [Sediminibacterium roseum]NCI50067.1 hypothetical protein [Sediminibacterium roseum]
MAVPFNILKTHLANAGKRKITWILLIVFATMVGLHFFIFDFMVPKTAPLAMPFKWRRVPLRENRETVRGYYGVPEPSHASVAADEWLRGEKGKLYILKVYYINDTVAASYSVRYRYDRWFGAREYVIDSGAIR